ncbi:MAG: murein biosynthesis integral membrane protein MurJ [Desulfovibrionales bacterium]|nr:murein biosynthesis integral membrane protein MurJ [Desulfovibrionales bacterium]
MSKKNSKSEIRNPKLKETDTAQIARSAGSVSVAVFASRILGLIREQVLAGLFGAGYFIDAYVVAFRIPNLLRDLFAEGALSSAFVTVFTDYDQKKGPKETWRLANNVLTSLFIIVGALTLIGIFFAGDIIMLMAPDFSRIPGKIALTRDMTVIMFPFFILVSLAAAVMGMLNTKGYFFIPAMSSAFFNLGSIVSGVILAFVFPRFGQPAIVGMAVGTLIGGFLQLAIQLPSLHKVGFHLSPLLSFRDEGLHRVIKLMIPAIIGLSATQLNIFINTYFAASCEQGSVSWLNYAFRLMQFPIGVFGVAISIATLPVVSRHASNKDLTQLKGAYLSALVMAFALTIPASCGLVILAKPIIKLIFEHGRFTGYDTLHTAEALSFYAIGLFAYASVKIIVPVFYALDDTKYPVIASFMAVVVNILVITMTIDSFQHKAIAFSTSITMILNFVFLSLILYRKVEGYDLGYLFKSLAKVLMASAAMGLIVYYVHGWLEGIWGHGLHAELFSLSITIAFAGFSYFFLLYALRLKEWRVLAEKFVKRART